MPIITTSPSTGAKSATVSPKTGAVSNPSPGTTSAGSKGDVPYYAQSLFDSRIYSLVFPMERNDTEAPTNGGGYNGGLTRGMMIWDKAYPPYTHQAEMHFLFNPTTVTATYSVDSGDASTSLMYRSPTDTAQAAFAMNQTVSFSLYYDRTFELWGSYGASGVPNPQTVGPNGKMQDTSSANPNINGMNPMDPTVYGVNVDIMAMKQITGMFLNQLSAPSGAATGAPTSNASPGLSQQGVMCMLPTWVYFGAKTGLVYYGYISSFTVTVTHWTQFMIPMRAVIDVGFNLLVPSADQKDGPTFTDWNTLAQLAIGTSAADSANGQQTISKATGNNSNLSTGKAGR